MTAKIEKVLLLDGVDPVCGEILQNAGIKVTVHAKLSKEQLLEELKVSSEKKKREWVVIIIHGRKV